MTGYTQHKYRLITRRMPSSLGIYLFTCVWAGMRVYTHVYAGAFYIVLGIWCWVFRLAQALLPTELSLQPLSGFPIKTAN